MKLKDYFQALLQVMEKMWEEGKLTEDEIEAFRKLTQIIGRIENLCSEASDKGFACSIMTLLESEDSEAKFKGIVVSLMDEKGKKTHKKYSVRELLFIDGDKISKDFSELISTFS